jgi:hypothetical protein
MGKRHRLANSVLIAAILVALALFLVPLLRGVWIMLTHTDHWLPSRDAGGV